MPDITSNQQEQNAALEIRLADARHRIEQADLLIKDLTQRLNRVESSTVWRILRPLHIFGSRFPRLARRLRQTLRLVWWTVTLQMLKRYTLWRAHRHLRLQSIQAPMLIEDLSMEASETLIPQSEIILCSSNDPVLSIVVPTYGQLMATLACLKSLADHPPCCAFEVIVMDDAYVGLEDMDVLRNVKGIRYFRNEINIGFLRSCNLASRMARGGFLYILNNDTEVRSGTIDSLKALLTERPDAGMVGSKLLFPGGRLQEAGGILWTDASGWNYGRGEASTRPEYNYVREVDYCSGASIMIRQALFESLGGFDEGFAPAYYEDVDLAFRVRALGLKVLYQPLSEVTHHEGLSHGTDTLTGVKAHQVSNRTRMLKLWRETLVKENYASGEHLLRARDRGRAQKVILVIDHYVPEPDQDAGSRSVLGIVDSLIGAGWIVKFWPHNRAYSSKYTPGLEQRGIEVIDHRWPGDLNLWIRDHGAELDQVLAIRPDVAIDVLSSLLRVPNALLSFYGVDLHFARMRRQAELTKDPDLLRDAAMMERSERRVWKNFDIVLYPSEEEAAEVRALMPGTDARCIVPFCSEISQSRTLPPRERNLLFVAGFGHPPNVDAAVFLVMEIIPSLIRRTGPVKVVLAGSNPTQAVYALAGTHVNVTGYVTDTRLDELYNTHRASIVPLRFGAGVKGKVVESLSHGLPMVTTSIGAQGIAGISDIVPVRDDVNGIVEALEVLLTDDAAWIAQSAAQLKFAQQNFSRDAMSHSVLKVLGDGKRMES